MSKIENCKGCTATVRVSLKDIDEMIARIVKSNSFNITDKDEYNERLKTCMECRYLEFGTTCRQCGCVVQIKAKIRNQKCPYPKNSKWGKI